MADNDNSNGLAGTPKVPSSKSSDISIEEIVPEDADDSLTEQKPEKDEAADISKSEVAASGEIEEKGKEGEKPATEDAGKSENAKENSSEVEKVHSADSSARSAEPSDKSSTAVVTLDNSNSDEGDDDDDDDFEDESIMERLVALTEMFPSGLAKGIASISQGSVDGVKWTYSKSRNLTWILFSTATLLFLPVMIESERVGFEEMEKARKQQILLGPSSAMSSGPGQNAPLPPTAM